MIEKTQESRGEASEEEEEEEEFIPFDIHTMNLESNKL